MLRRLGALRQLAGLPCWSPASAAPRAASTLSYEVVEASASAGAAVAAAAPPVRTAFLLHGLLGQGRNWRTFARRLVAAAAEAGAPNWRLLLVDLRCHGQTAVRCAHAHACTRHAPPAS
jgi:pimeloyl-ACP methyl ester carboxylesterase